MDPERLLRLFAREGMRVLAKAGLAAADTILAEAQGAADEAGNRVRKTRRKIAKVTHPEQTKRRVVEVELEEEE
jgi:hypothetical protein